MVAMMSTWIVPGTVSRQEGHLENKFNLSSVDASSLLKAMISLFV